MSRPTEKPEWATGGSAEVTAPPAATEAQGWLATIKPPNAFVNWFFNRAYQWIDHFSRVAAEYTDLAEAATTADLAVGETCIVFEDETGDGPGETDVSVTSVAASAGVIVPIAADGARVIYSVGDRDLIGMDRDLTGANGTGNDVDYVRTNTGAVNSIASDGAIVVAAYGNYVEAWDVDGTQLWVVDRAATTYGVAIGPDGVYACGTISAGGGDVTANKHVHKLNRSTGAIIWEYQHSATGASDVIHMATNGQQVFLYGDVSSYGSGATVRSLNASNGYDAANEGGTGQDTEGRAWDQVIGGNPTILEDSLAIGHGLVFVGLDSGETNQIVAVGQGDGETVWTVAHPDSAYDCYAIAVDQDQIVCAFGDTGDGYLEARSVRDGAVIWRWRHTSGAIEPVGVASDGCKVYTHDLTTAAMFRVTRGNVPTIFRRSTTTEFGRLGNWIMQPTQRRT